MNPNYKFHTHFLVVLPLISNATFGVSNLSSSGSSDVFTAKLDSNSDWLWVISAGGTGSDTGNGISTDAGGNCYVAGSFAGVANFGSMILTSAGGVDIVVTKIDPNGNWLWAKRAGGTGADTAYSIATDIIGNSYVTGFFSGTAGFDSTNLISNGANDIFSNKLDTNGYWPWTNQAGGSSLDIGYGISTDASGNCYVTGVILGAATFGTTSINLSSSNDICIAKIGLPYPLITTNVHESLDFGNVYLDTPSPHIPVWIKNTGMAELVINDISTLQAYSAFKIQPTLCPSPWRQGTAYVSICCLHLYPVYKG